MANGIVGLPIFAFCHWQSLTEEPDTAQARLLATGVLALTNHE